MIRIGAPQEDDVAVASMADHGLLCTFGGRIDAELSTRIAALTDTLTAESLAGVEDYVPSYTTLVIIIEPAVADVPGIVDRVSHHWRRIRRQPVDRGAGREVVIPVHYGDKAGPDLQDVSRVTGLAPDEVISRHSGSRYQVGAIGFSPGFAFLIGLPPELAVPRRSTPRTAVPPGSVGIGGSQTGIYSLETPGGWSLIGRTPLVMFDPERDPPSLLQAGDSVRFEPVLDEPRKAARPVSTAPANLPSPAALYGNAIEVLEAGLQTSVQDLGRPGYGRLGIAPGGATDRGALIRGNRLLGNPDGAAGIEIALVGPRLRFLEPDRIAITGADLGACLNGMRLMAGSVRVVGPGDELSFDHGRKRGARTYLCIRGGIDVPIQLGSRSTDLTAGFGGFQGRALRVGDRLRVGASVNDREESSGGEREDTRFSPTRDHVRGGRGLRVVRGPHISRFNDAAYETLFSREFTVSPKSNRLGLRLAGPTILPLGGADIISEGMVTGAIQVTGEGQPIVMLPARATIGGYPKIATVIAADLDRLGQLRPGSRIRFEDHTATLGGQE